MTVRTPGGLTVSEEQFALALAAGVRQIDAYAAAYPRQRYNANTLRKKASMLYQTPRVKARVDELLALGGAAAVRTIEEIHSQFARLAFADARELSGVRVHCCRYCWGKGFRRQYTPAEMERRRKEWQARPARGRGRFDEEGGVGYDKRRPPNEDCPECWGQGEWTPYLADTRFLSKDGAAVFGGVEIQERGGVKVKLRDQDGALDRLARVMGAYAKDNAQPLDELSKALRDICGNVIGPNTDPHAGDDDHDDT